LTALTDAGVALPTGWPRTTYANLFAAVTATLTGHIFIGSSSISARSPALSAKASKAVEGAGIPTSTTVVSITSTTIVISQNAASLRICPWGNGDGSTTFNVPDRRYRTLVGRDNRLRCPTQLQK
jgi:hypothetical protein